MDLEYIILHLKGASALVCALGATGGLRDNGAAHSAVQDIIDKAIENLEALGALPEE